ncbi:MAG: hypothetical protein GX589_03300 [Deltaproteobacteria bacterium]|nr:hypothetical protein [Deltaproteobacteria bacterium]
MVSSIGKPDAIRQDCGLPEKSSERTAPQDKEAFDAAAVVAVQLKRGKDRPDAIRSLALAESETQRIAAAIMANNPGILEIHNLDPARVEFFTRDEA